MKKALKITGIVLLVLILALVSIPIFFKDAVKRKIIATINENVDATVTFEDAGISLFRNFPQATVDIDKLVIINKAPFEGDTLFSMGELQLKMSVKELFKGDNEPMNIESFTTKNGLVNILFNKDGIGNFDIALKDAKDKDEPGKEDPLSLKIKEYKIENYQFKYFDERSKVSLTLDSLFHSGSGDFTADKLDLVTKSAARASFSMDKSSYLSKVPLTLDATIGIDTKAQTYTFKDNKALINRLPLEFAGMIKMLEEGQQYDLTFKTPSSDFKNFLGVIPSAYAGNLDGVKTTGEFTVSGFAKGNYTDTTVPRFDIRIASANASFQYPDLPKAVRNIVIDTHIVNETGVLNDTYVNLDKLSFAIDQDVFNASAKITNVVENANVDAALKGTLNLGNLSRAYPIKLDKPLSGILRADVKSRFDMESVEKSAYERIYNEGDLDLTGFKYIDDNGKALTINRAVVQFNPSRVNLQQLQATTGKTDLTASGVLENFYGFVFKDQGLKGNFTLKSNQLAVADFMTEPSKETAQAKQPDALEIPAFLDCKLTATANTVLYDNLVLKNVSGVVIVKDQKATLQNVKTNIFGGLIGANGSVSTKGKTPTFEMDLNLNAVDISQTFTQLDMMKSIAPIAGAVNGKLNSTIKVSGNLDAREMTPDLKTINGSLTSQLLSTTINPSNSKMVSALDNQLGFIDLSKINLNDLKTALTFQNGRVNLKPVSLKYKDIGLSFDGAHGFDQTMAYNLKFDVPAKYLGTEANALLAKLSPADAAKIENVPIAATLTGNFANPKIQTDMKQAVSNLTAQLIKAQKDKLINQGTSAIGNILSGNTKKDTTKPATNNTKDNVTKQAQNVLNNIFNKPKKQEKPAEEKK